VRNTPRLLRIPISALALLCLFVLLPMLGCAAIGVWLPRAVFALVEGGTTALSKVSLLSEPTIAPQWLKYLQLIGMATFGIVAAVIGEKVWRTSVLKWGLATAEEIEDFEKHAK
jgi:hypothetical protein